MISAYDWSDYLLLVTVDTGRDGRTYGLLCHYASQEDVMEFVITKFAKAPTGISVVTLTEESYDILREHAPYVVGED